jgi:predicted negative regulator of RcsB-dependent stress response
MNKLCATLLLIFAVWFGWQRYAEHQAKIERAQRERFEDYERCTSALDQAHFANHSDEQEWMKARDDCRKLLQ